MRTAAVLGALVALALAGEDAVVRHRLTVLTGQYVDLDTGTVLSQPRAGDLVADLRVFREGTAFLLRIQRGTVAREAAAMTAPTEGYSVQPLRLDAHQPNRSRTWYLRTDRSRYAKLGAEAGFPNSLGAVVLEYEYNPTGGREFPATPEPPLADWADGALSLRWDGLPHRYVVTAVQGDRRITVEVSEPKAALRGLAPGAACRIEVARVTEAGLRSAPAVGTFETGPRRLVRGDAVFPARWYDKGGGLSLETTAAFDPDPHLIFFLHGIHAPGGGIQHAGKGAEDFLELSELPTDGYLPFFPRLAAGDVFAVRTADGRFGKIWLDDTAGSDVRSGMLVRCVYLAGGGYVLPGRPTEPEWESTDAGVRLNWLEADGAQAYRVREAGGREPLWEGAAGECLLERLAPRRTYALELFAVHPGGVESEPTPLLVHTYPERYRVGTFTLNTRSRNGFSFVDGTVQQRRGTGDFFLARYSGRNTITMAAPSGVGRPPGHEFGRLDGQVFRPRPGTEYTLVGTATAKPFCVRSGEGGLASVRLLRYRYPNALFEYVYRPPLWDEDSLVVSAGVVHWDAPKGARAYRIGVRGSGRKAIVTEKTSWRLPPLRRNAFHTVEIVALFADGRESETAAVTANTFSDNYRLGEGTLTPYGRDGIIFATERVSKDRNETDLSFRMVAADRLAISTPGGASLDHGLGYGEFPPLTSGRIGEAQWQTSVSELVDGVLLVGTRDGGLASVRVWTAFQNRQVLLEYVYRPSLTMDEVLAAIRKAAPEPAEADAKEARRLLALLADADARVRDHALAGLLKLELRPAHILLEQREREQDPDVRRLLDRWALTIYEAKIG